MKREGTIFLPLWAKNIALLTLSFRPFSQYFLYSNSVKIVASQTHHLWRLDNSMHNSNSKRKKDRSARVFSSLHKNMTTWYTYTRRGIAMSGWMLLGLGLITTSVEVLFKLPIWSGPFVFAQLDLFTTDSVLTKQTTNIMHATAIYKTQDTLMGTLWQTCWPIVDTILLYLLLTLIQHRWLKQTKRHTAYIYIVLLLVVSIELSMGIFLLDDTQRFSFYILAYAVAAFVGVHCSKRQGLLIDGVILASILLSMVIASINTYAQIRYLPTRGIAHVTENVDSINHMVLIAPKLGLGLNDTTALFQFGIWLLGLVVLHIFTAIGVHERTARQQSETLVQELTLAQAQLRTYALRVEELATMRERARVAREVHDTLAQGLAAIKMHLEVGATIVYEKPELAKKHMERARDLAGEHLYDARTTILALRTDALGGQILPSALAALAATWRPKYNASDGHATFSVSDATQEFWQTLPPALELACYRITQEALSNADKHGKAHSVAIELSIEQYNLCLTVTDDGVGFDPATIRHGTHDGGFGIIGMHERMRLLNGRLEIISAPGAGTQVAMMVPLEMLRTGTPAKSK